MGHITTLDELKQNINALAFADESNSPYVSAYFNFEQGQDLWRAFIDERVRVLGKLLKGDQLDDLHESISQIESWLEKELLPESLGAAIFVRGSRNGGFMLPMQFAAPMPNVLALYPTPNIYNLMELKDTYHRYIVLLALPSRATILEVNLGAATTQAWIDRADLRQRVGDEWSRPHYQVHRTQRGDRFLQEKIGLLEKQMRAGGHSHLILAGDATITRRVRQALPEDLVEKLVDVVPASQQDHQTDVVLATLSSFIEHEERESQSLADALLEGLLNQSLAVAGSQATLAALRWGDVDVLVMDNSYRPDPGWYCRKCNSMGTRAPETVLCPKCGEQAVRPLDVKEAILRMAGQTECPVEVVEQSSTLTLLGGVGCLLRKELEIDTGSATPCLPLPAAQKKRWP